MSRQRFHQFVLITGLTCFSWLAMMLVHESGHVLGAWLTGGKMQRLIWHPLTFSRTDIDPNPSPLVVVWSGPLVGICVPFVGAGVASVLRLRVAYVVVFFAGFCLIANGAYISLGIADRIGDAGDMVRWGTPMWLMVLFGVVTVPAGLWLWHRGSPQLGFGRPRQRIAASHAYGALIAALLLFVIGLIVGDRGS